MFINENWKEFLKQQGASFEGDVVNQFSEKSEELKYTQDTNILADLSQFGLISVEGEDAESFLQNQFSNDIRLVSETQSQLSAYCSPKGRMLAGFLVYKRESAYFLRLPANILEPTLKRLKMFVLRSQVNLENVSEQQIRLGIAGPESTGLLQSEFENIPTETNQVVHTDKISIIRLAGPVPRFELHGDLDSMKNLFEQLRKKSNPIGMHAWQWLAIKAGIPEIYPQTIEAFIPQMVNFSALDGINFKKGCYPGQEVVARMHYLGKLKRRMYLLHADSDITPQPGDELYCKSSAESACGKIVEAQAAPDGGVDLLAVIQIAKAESESVYLESLAGPELQMRELPYPVTNEA